MVTKIGSGWGYVNYEKNSIQIRLISKQTLYFGDDDAIHDIIMEEPVRK